MPPSKIKIASNGIRDYEYTIKKPKGSYRIIILGDSVAFGWGVDIEKTFAKRLEKLLNSKAKKKYEVINFAVPGYNLRQEIDTLKYKCLAYKPDLVIFCVQNNDYRLLFNYHCPVKILEFIPSCLVKSCLICTILGRYIMEMDRIRDNKFEEGLNETASAIQDLSKIIEENKVSVLFYPDIEWMAPLLKKNYLGNRIIHSGKSCFEDSRYIFKDDGHPNALGHQKIAEELYAYLSIFVPNTKN
ncbi:MAG: SGNH/GDSL hydrolase family protein [Candidatus Omnitrophota bacterium]